jgi:hypothetical protein
MATTQKAPPSNGTETQSVAHPLTQQEVRDAIFHDNEKIQKTAERYVGAWLKNQGNYDEVTVREIVWDTVQSALEHSEPFTDTAHLERWITVLSKRRLVDKWRHEQVITVPFSAITKPEETVDDALSRRAKSGKYSREQLQELSRGWMIGSLDASFRKEHGIQGLFGGNEELVAIHLHDGPPRSAWAKKAGIPRLMWVDPDVLAKNLEKAAPSPVVREALEEHITAGTEYETLYIHHAKGKAFGERGGSSEENFYRQMKLAKRRLRILLPESVPRPRTWRRPC